MYFVFDVETIPDLPFIREILESPEEDDEALLQQAGEQLSGGPSGSLPPMYQQIVAWVGLWIENSGAPSRQHSWHGREEKEGLQALFKALGTYKDFGLIHHNGRGFDLPLLTYRAMKHGLQMPLRLNHHEIKYRYSNHNIDLPDEFSNYGASSWPRLKHLGHLINLPVKQTGDGAELLDLFRRGALPEIEHDCHEEVMATYIVWLHLKYTVGDIPKKRFDNLHERARNKLQEIRQK